MISALFLLLTLFVAKVWAVDIDVFVDKSYRKYIPNPYYLGVTLDSCFIKYDFCGIDWIKAIRLARFLGPGYLRIGGTDADYLNFVPPKKEIDHDIDNQISAKNRQKRDFFATESQIFGDRLNPVKCSTESMFVHSQFNMSAPQLDRIMWFVCNAGWRLIFDLNLAKRTEDNAWDPSNAIEFLDYADRMGYSMDFELGNEMNGYPHSMNLTVNASQLVQDYAVLRNLLKKYPTFKNSKLVGPAIGSFTRILSDFLQDGGGNVVDAVTLHQYYGPGPGAKIDEFFDPHRLNGLYDDFAPVLQKIKKYYPTRPPKVWYGETSSMYTGGAKNLSDRYVAGFMWLDKLGMSARDGLTGVIRQTLFMGNYALLDPDTNPNPDFWLSALYKKLVGPIVLRAVAIFEINSVRFYAHCQRNNDLTLYGMNLLNDSAMVSFPFLYKKVKQYLLEPANGDLTTKDVLLNGKQMKIDGANFPNLKPKTLSQPVILPAKRFAFYVFKNGCPV